MRLKARLGPAKRLDRNRRNRVGDVAFKALKVVIEKLRKLARLLVIGCLVGPGSAWIENCRWHIGHTFGNSQAEKALGFILVEYPPFDCGIDHRSRVRDC